MALLLPGAGGRHAHHHQRKPGWGAWLLLAPLGLWLILFVVVPTALLVVWSFCQRDPDSLGRVVYQFTTENYAKAFSPVYLKILRDSIWYAFLTTVLCLIMGFPVAYFIGRAPQKWRNLLLLLVMIPFWTSFLVRTYAWMILLRSGGHARTPHPPAATLSRRTSQRWQSSSRPTSRGC